MRDINRLPTFLAGDHMVTIKILLTAGMNFLSEKNHNA